MNHATPEASSSSTPEASSSYPTAAGSADATGSPATPAGQERPQRRSWRAWIDPHWHPYPVFAALGALSAVYFAITGSVWAVTGEFTRLGGQLLAVFGVDTESWAYYELIHLEGNPLTRTDGWIVIAMLIGALAAALLAGDVKWRVPRLRRRMVQGFVGGIVAGFGARLALGCNLAAMFTGVPQFSFHAWIFTATTAAGTYLGIHLIRRRWWRGPTLLSPAGSSTASPRTMTPERQRRLGLAVAIGMALLVVGYAATGQGMLAVAAGFGAVFGVLIQRGQICFTAAFRDLWLTGRTLLGKALVLGLIVATIGTFVVLQVGDVAPQIKPAGLGTLFGGLLFGLGIVMAGGCETGMMYRAMEGQFHYWLVFAGNIVGATVLAYGWDHWGIQRALVADAPKVDLVASWGPTAALAATLGVLILWYAAMVHRERRTTGSARRVRPSVEPAPTAKETTDV